MRAQALARDGNKPLAAARMHRRPGGGGALRHAQHAAHPRGPPAAAVAPAAAAGAAAGTAAALAERMLSYQYSATLPCGSVLVIEALRETWQEPCADLLASSFIAAANLGPYGRFVRRRIGLYLAEHIALAPKALVLTAVVEPPAAAAAGGGDSASNGSGAGGSGRAQGSSIDGSGRAASGAAASSSSSVGGSGAASSGSGGEAGQVLIGTGEVSLDPSTRSSYLTLNPPAKGAYVCNMAVAPGWRRRGVARHLLAALEEVAALAGEEAAYLHLRMKDNAEAGTLYRGCGYSEAKADSPLAFLLGVERRWLMRKLLTRGGEIG